MRQNRVFPKVFMEVEVGLGVVVVCFLGLGWMMRSYNPCLVMVISTIIPPLPIPNTQ